MQKVKAVKDGDGHWFVIPADQITAFHQMLESSELADDYEAFNDQFADYMTGGDLNLVQLYAEI